MSHPTQGKGKCSVLSHKEVGGKEGNGQRDDKCSVWGSCSRAESTRVLIINWREHIEDLWASRNGTNLAKEWVETEHLSRVHCVKAGQRWQFQGWDLNVLTVDGLV